VKPTNPGLRGLGAAVGFVAAGGLALLVFPAVLSIIVFLAGPALSAFLLSGGHRDTFGANGIAASVAAGVLGAAWIGALSDARPLSVLIGAFVSLVLLTLLASFGCYLLGKFAFRQGALGDAEE
jgi:hypothetical protein